MAAAGSAASRTISVQFTIALTPAQLHVNGGCELCVLGSPAELGCWRPTCALPVALSPVDGGLRASVVVSLELPAEDVSVQYVYITRSADGRLAGWERRSARTLKLAGSARSAHVEDSMLQGETAQDRTVAPPPPLAVPGALSPALLGMETACMSLVGPDCDELLCLLTVPAQAVTGGGATLAADLLGPGPTAALSVACYCDAILGHVVTLRVPGRSLAGRFVRLSVCAASGEVVGRLVLGSDELVSRLCGCLVRPLLTPSGDAVAAELELRFVVCLPLAHAANSLERLWRISGAATGGVRLFGHRGLGSNRDYLANRTFVRENSITSFLAAAKAGADGVELDVQLSADGVPFIVHDFRLRAPVPAGSPDAAIDCVLAAYGMPPDEPGADPCGVGRVWQVPVHWLSARQLRGMRLPSTYLARAAAAEEASLSAAALGAAVSEARSPQAFAGAALSLAPGQPVRRRASLSHVLSSAEHARLAHRAPPRSAFVFVTDGAATLGQLLAVLRARAPDLAVNVELKYPYEPRDVAELGSVVERNAWLDTVLAAVLQAPACEALFFSSFDPDLAIMCRAKQARWPVLLLTEAATEGTRYADERLNSLEAAAAVCRLAGLHGVVADVRAVLAQPDFAAVAHADGLVLYTYGKANCDEAAIRTQLAAGVDGIITDNIKLVRRVLLHSRS